jgi:hypothetical protein
MINGFPSEKIVPFGEVTLTASEVAISTENAAGAVTSFAETNFTFPSPVYLQNNTEYCFVLLPAGNDPGYTAWVSELGENEVGITEGASKRISEQPNVGMLFTSANNRTWSEKQAEDMKFTLYRAIFDTSVISTAKFQNSNYDYLALSEEMLLVSNNAVSLTKFAAGEKVYVLGSESTKFGYVKQYDPLYNVLKVVVQAGVFTAADTITNGIIKTTVTEVEDKLINSIQTNIGYMDFTPTTGVWSYAKTATGAVSAGSTYDRLTFGETNDILTEAAIFSKSNETADLGGSKSLNIRFGMKTMTDTVSPVIDLRKCSLICISNHINADTGADEDTNDGTASSKYISRRVNLETDAEDLKVYLSNYLPSGTSARVYAKLQNPSDSRNFEDLDWVELETSASPLSSTAAAGFVEYEYKIPKANKVGAVEDGAFTYTNSGATYTRYNKMAIKIVMFSNNSSIVPKFKELRAIALQV